MELLRLRGRGPSWTSLQLDWCWLSAVQALYSLSSLLCSKCKTIPTTIKLVATLRSTLSWPFHSTMRTFMEEQMIWLLRCSTRSFRVSWSPMLFMYGTCASFWLVAGQDSQKLITMGTQTETVSLPAGSWREPTMMGHVTGHSTHVRRKRIKSKLKRLSVLSCSKLNKTVETLRSSLLLSLIWPPTIWEPRCWIASSTISLMKDGSLIHSQPNFEEKFSSLICHRTSNPRTIWKISASMRNKTWFSKPWRRWRTTRVLRAVRLWKSWCS